MNRFVPSLVLVLVLLVAGATRANAQIVLNPPPPDPPPAPLTSDRAKNPPTWLAEGRACDGCPPRSVGKALWQTTAVNVVYELANLIRGQVTARITPKTWWANMQQGWVWDLDDFKVNQIGHPYQGNNYFNTGRANGLSFYESAAVTAFGSATWEYFGETNSPSLNDFINTTLGGIALGEMFHRAGWLVRDTHATGSSRLWSEIGATALDPVTGLNRFITGDASRVSDTPAEFVPASLNGIFSAGVLWRGAANTDISDAQGEPFLEANLLYGDVGAGRSRTPFDAFAVRLTLGGGAGLSEAQVRGRLLGQPIGGDRAEFMAVQAYDYQANNAYHYGAQSFNATTVFTSHLTSRTSLVFGGSGGVTVLGAVDSLPVGLEAVPEEPEQPEGEQGVSEGPRFYDYGPGSNYSVFASLRRDRKALVEFTYDGRQLYSLDGVRANHFLQRARLDVLAPLRNKFGLGVTGEFFDRRTYYQDAIRTVKKFHYPQVRFYFTWSMS